MKHIIYFIYITDENYNCIYDSFEHSDSFEFDVEDDEFDVHNIEHLIKMRSKNEVRDILIDNQYLMDEDKHYESLNIGITYWIDNDDDEISFKYHYNVDKIYRLYMNTGFASKKPVCIDEYWDFEEAKAAFHEFKRDWLHLDNNIELIADYYYDGAKISDDPDFQDSILFAYSKE